MGGKGSGRKDKTSELLSSMAIPKVNPISNTTESEMVMPNHSGVSTHPEMLGDSGFVKKTGDTMTGNLTISHDPAKLDLIDSAGATDDKNLSLKVDGGIAGWSSRNDDLSLRKTNIMTMDLETGKINLANDLTTVGNIITTDLHISRDSGDIIWTGVNNTNINVFKSGAGSSIRMDFNPIPEDDSSAAEIGFFRSTDTSGARTFTIFKGNNTTTSMFSVDGETGNVTAGDGTGNLTVAGSTEANLLFTKSDDNRVGIGTNTPAELLDVDGNACIAGTLDAGVTTINSDLILDAGSITSASGAISFGNENLTTTGTLNSATITTIGLGIIGGDLQINGGDITSTGSAMRFTGLDVTVGTLTNGQITISEDDITSNTGQINFGNENLSTTGTLTVTKLEVNDSSLTNATGHISSTTTVWNPKANGTIGASTLQLSSDVTGGDDNYGASLAFSRLDTEVAKSAAIVAVQTSSDVDQVGLAFFTHPSATTSADVIEQMRIEHDGKIGIGTTSPSTILHAKDAGVNSAPAITLENDARAFSFEVDGSDGDKLKIRTDVFTRDIMSFEDDSKAQMMDFTNSAITINGANQDIDFIVKDDAGNTAFFIQGSDGNVGIGTTSPRGTVEIKAVDAKLLIGGTDSTVLTDDILGTIAFTTGDSSGTPPTNDIAATITAIAGNNHTSGNFDTEIAFSVVEDSTLNEAMRIDRVGYVGIGTSSPTEKLEVIGNIMASKTSSDVVITGETTNADARLVLNNTGNGRHSGIQLVRERLSGTGMTAASIFVNSDTSTNNTQLIIQCNSSTNIGSLGPTDQRIVLDSATDTMDIDNCSIMIQEIASARIVKAGYGQIWVKNTTPCELWFTDDAGTDTQIV